MSKITSFLHKTFQSLQSSIILPFGRIGYYLTKCAKSNSYVETLGKHADSIHIWVKESYEEDFFKAFEIQIRKALKNLHVSYAKLAFDFTTEPFYGKTRNLYVFNTSKEHSYDGEFKYATVCLIVRNKEIPLMALPVRVGEGVARPTIELLEYCQTLFKRIRFTVFDRGFYVDELIDYLEARKIKYIILVPEKKGVIKEYVESTNKLCKYPHQLRYPKDKSIWKPKTTIVVCKGIDDFAWIFATNIHFKTRVEYIWHYKRRWQIETNYRVEDEAKIKSKSTKYMIRYFYFLIGLLFHLLWIVNKYLNYYVPFKKYLDIIEQKLLFEYLKIEQI